MRKLLLPVIAFILLFQVSTQADNRTWKKLLNAATFDVQVNPANPNTIIAGGESRTLYRSYDAGMTWDTLLMDYSGTTAQFNNIMLYPQDTNVVVIGGLMFGSVRRSTDQGSSWKTVLNSNDDFTTISLNGKALINKPDETNISYLAEMGKGNIFKSTNNGLSWDSISTIGMIKTIRNEDGMVVDTFIPSKLCAMGIRDDSTNIVLCGTIEGNIFISKDHGKNWTFADSLVFVRQPEPEDCELTRITFSKRNPLVGYIIITYIVPYNKPNGGLWKTTDGGYQWEFVAFADTSMWAVATRDNGIDDEVVMGGYTEVFWYSDRIPGVGLVRASSDGGKSWYSFDDKIDWYWEDIQIQGTLYKISSFDRTHSFSSGEPGLAMNISPHGWEHTQYGTHTKYYSHQIISKDTILICGEKGIIMKTTDNGVTWFAISINASSDLLSMHFLNSKYGCISTRDGSIYRSTNAGDTWAKIATPTGNPLYSICLSDENYGFAVGKLNTILVTTNQGLSWAKSSSVLPLQQITDFTCVTFPTPQIGFITGKNGTLLKTVDRGLNWTKIDVTTKNLNGVHFLNENIGMVVGDSGTIYKTTDGGLSWRIKPFYNQRGLLSITFTSEKIGYICGSTGVVLKTTDGGNSWKETYSRSLAARYAMYFFDDSKGYLCGSEGNISITTNAGSYWRHQNYLKDQELTSITFLNNDNGIAVGTGGIITTTTNGGLNWTATSHEDSSLFYNVQFTDGNTGYICGEKGIILKTVNAGQSWNKLNSGFTDTLCCMSFKDSQTGYAVGDDGTVLKTTNAGDLWVKEDFQVTSNLRFVKFFNNDLGFIAGDDGVILKTSNGGANWVKLNTESKMSIFSVGVSNDNNIFAVGLAYAGAIIRSTDGGTTWFNTDYDTTQTYNSVYMLDESNIAICGNERVIIESRNGGYCWALSDKGYPTRENVWSLRYFGETGKEKLYMATEAGLFVYDDSQINAVTNPINTEDLVSVYSSSNRTVHYTYNRPGKLDSKLYMRVMNSNGEVVYSGLPQSPGESVTGSIDMSHYSAGVYFIQFLDGKRRIEEKFILE